MMMNEPGSEQIPSDPFSQRDLDFSETDRQLARTKPWVRFVSLLGVAMCIFSLVSFLSQSLPGAVSMTAVSAFMFLVALLFYLIPSILLWNYGSRIGEYLRASNALSLSEALAAQRAFWKYLGILALIVIVLYVAVIAVAVAMSAMATMR